MAIVDSLCYRQLPLLHQWQGFFQLVYYLILRIQSQYIIFHTLEPSVCSQIHLKIKKVDKICIPVASFTTRSLIFDYHYTVPKNMFSSFDLHHLTVYCDYPEIHIYKENKSTYLQLKPCRLQANRCG